MSQYIMQKKISIANAQPGMVLAKDVITSSGMVLFKKGYVLQSEILDKLEKYEIEHIFIEENCLVYEKHQNSAMIKNTIATSPQKTPISTELFKKFHGTYAQNTYLIQDIIKDISQGKFIDIDYLFSLSCEMLRLLDCKSDLFTLLHNLRNADDYTYSHCVNVSLICSVFGQWLELSDNELKNLTVSGLLHDIGKTKIDIRILNKPDKLTEEEFEEIKKHPLYGYDLVKDQNIPEEIKMSILQHHEKFDGTGYPMGITNDKIHDFAKIVSISDIYDAMTSSRAYRGKFCPFRVIQTFEQQCYGKLDTKYLLIFLQYIANYYLGDWVRLSSGEEAEIIFIHQNNLSKPIVRVGDKMVDLRANPNLWIEEMI